MTNLGSPSRPRFNHMPLANRPRAITWSGATILSSKRPNPSLAGRKIGEIDRLHFFGRNYHNSEILSRYLFIFQVACLLTHFLPWSNLAFIIYGLPRWWILEHAPHSRT